MEAHDSASDRDADLMAAAQAAASWARARRATWTNAPLDVAAAAPAVPPPAFDVVPTTAPTRPPAAAIPVQRRSEPSAAARLATSVRSFGPLLMPWLARVAVAAALGAAAFIAVPYMWRALPTLMPRRSVVEPTTGQAPAAARTPTGTLRVSSTPAGAQVLVDGQARGVTPLSITDLSPGRHEVATKSDAGIVRRTVTIVANETADVDGSIFPGWLAVYSPFNVIISEDGRALRLDERDQIMLPPGIHELRVANRALAYEAVRRVEVKPGQTTILRLTPGPSTLTVTASEPADVWLDATRLGETPLNAVPVPLGTHELVVRRTTGGERRFTVTIGANPFTLNVDFH